MKKKKKIVGIIRASVVGSLTLPISVSWDITPRVCCTRWIFPMRGACQSHWLPSKLAANCALARQSCSRPCSDSLCHVISPVFWTKAIGDFHAAFPTLVALSGHRRSRILGWVVVAIFSSLLPTTRDLLWLSSPPLNGGTGFVRFGFSTLSYQRHRVCIDWILSPLSCRLRVCVQWLSLPLWLPT